MAKEELSAPNRLKVPELLGSGLSGSPISFPSEKRVGDEEARDGAAEDGEVGVGQIGLVAEEPVGGSIAFHNELGDLDELELRFVAAWRLGEQQTGKPVRLHAATVKSEHIAGAHGDEEQEVELSQLDDQRLLLVLEGERGVGEPGAATNGGCPLVWRCQ